MTYTQILLDNKGGITTITLSRPESLNALSFKLSEELEDALEKLATDDSTKIVILTGAAENMTLAEGLEFECKTLFDITDSNERIAAFRKGD